MVNNIRSYLEKKRALIEDWIDKNFPKGSGLGRRVIEASLYSLKAGGKRIRPILCLMGYELFRSDSEKVLPFACGLECIHTYSLIHDDLPCMDDDDFRRGKPSCHKAFDEATAILAGDGLLTLAFEWFTHPKIIKEVSPLALLRAIHLVSKAVGLVGMVGGQMADLLAEGKKGDARTLNWIHTHKTVLFLEASLVSGAILAEAPNEEIKVLSKFGKKLGLLFQIIDDLLDIVGDEKTLGKPVKSDLKKKKITYPALYGVEKTRALAEKVHRDALQVLEALSHRDFKLLKELTVYLLNRVN